MAQPAMMAIGDSLFNGVRSLSITPAMAQWSPPAQVARALGIPFVIPDYPRHVVLNLEYWVSLFPNLLPIPFEIADNINFWNGWPKSSHEDFDNIAIASTTYRDMIKRTWKCAQAEIGPLLGTVELDKFVFAFNTRFLLNPNGDPNRPALSPVEIVAARKPERLLVSIGGNNGLWELTLEAYAGRGIGQPAGDGIPFNAADLSDLKDFVAALRALPPDVKHIYVNALGPPRYAANLMPYPDTTDTAKPGPGGYYPAYENEFGFSYSRLTGAQQQVNDDMVARVNNLVAQEARADPRIHIVPLDEAYAAYDFKADPNAKVVQVDHGRVISNLMLKGPHLTDPGRGGFMGMDGLHPTFVGYAVMAQEILKSIQRHEGISPQAMPDPVAAYHADTLLSNTPPAWNDLLAATLEIRRALAEVGSAPTTLMHQAAAELTRHVRFKID
jgi:hypothetical protein